MRKKKLTEEEIDEIVISEADDITKWEEPISVKPLGTALIRLSPDMIEKARYFAKVHNYHSYQIWLKRVIEDRIKTEEEILKELKQDLQSGSNR